MILTLKEIGTTPDSTASELSIDGRRFCMVVEDGYREVKEYGETRIPAGVYEIVPRRAGKFFQRYSQLYGHKFVPHLLNVPGFEWILIHTGNTVKDTKGCLLVNRSVGIGTDGDYFGTDSSSVYKLLYSLIDKAYERGEKVTIEISRNEISKKVVT